MNINFFNTNIGILDLLCLGIIIMAGYVGYKRGFVKSVVGLLSFVAAMAAAYILRPIIYDILMGTSLSDSVYNRISTSMAANTPSFSENPNVIQSIVSQAATESVSAVSAAVSGVVVSAASFLLVFFLVRLITKVASGILVGVVKLPVVGSVDKVLGLAAGVVKWSLLIYIILTVIIVFSVPIADGTLSEMIKNSALCNYIQNGELINRLFDVL